MSGGGERAPTFRFRGRDVSRLEAFSDAVFGFAATLVVVSLEVPTTFGDLRASLFGFVPFALSFTMLVFLWVVHNRFFRRYGLQDSTTLVLNSIFLFLVLFYVYPLKFMATSISYLYVVGGDEGQRLLRAMIPGYDAYRELLLIYGLGFTAIFLCVTLMYRHALARGDELGLSLLERHDTRTHTYHYAIFVGSGIVSMGTALLGIGMYIGFPGWVYAFLGPACFANGVIRGRQRDRLEAALAERGGAAAETEAAAVAT